MKLIPISEHPDAARILYDLLAERDPVANISHRAMPTWEEHLAFIASAPYEAWCLVLEMHLGIPVGSVYLTRTNEIGVSIFREWQASGYGPASVKLLMEMHGPRRYLANVAPANEASRKMFEKLGFRLVQHTYALEAE